MLGLQLSRNSLVLEVKDSRKSVSHNNLSSTNKLYKSMEVLNERCNSNDLDQMLKTLERSRLCPTREKQRKSRTGRATGQSINSHNFVPSKESGMFQQAETAYAEGDYETCLLLFHKLRRIRPNSQRYQMGILKTKNAIKEHDELTAKTNQAIDEESLFSEGTLEYVDSSDTDSHRAVTISTPDLASEETVKVRRKKGRRDQPDENHIHNKVVKAKNIKGSPSTSPQANRKQSISDETRFLHTAMSDEMLDQLERMLNDGDDDEYQTVNLKKSDSDETLKNCLSVELETAVQSSNIDAVNEASKIIASNDLDGKRMDDFETTETVSSEAAETIRTKKSPTPKEPLHPKKSPSAAGAKSLAGASALGVRLSAIRSYLARQARALEAALHSSDVEAVYRISRHMLQHLEKQRDELVPYRDLLRQYIYHHLAMADVHRNNFEGALSWLDTSLVAAPSPDASCSELEATLRCASLMARARVHAARRHPRRAAAALAELKQTAPKMSVSPERQLLIDTWLHHDLGWCYLEVDDISSASDCARVCLSRAEALGAADSGARWAAAARVLLARCHARTGAASEARSELRQAVKLARVAGDQKLANFAEVTILEIRDRRPSSVQVKKRDRKPR